MIKTPLVSDVDRVQAVQPVWNLLLLWLLCRGEELHSVEGGRLRTRFWKRQDESRTLQKRAHQVEGVPLTSCPPSRPLIRPPTSSVGRMRFRQNMTQSRFLIILNFLLVQKVYVKTCWRTNYSTERIQIRILIWILSHNVLKFIINTIFSLLFQYLQTCKIKTVVTTHYL